MAATTLLLGILLMVHLISVPQGKPLFGRFVKITAAFLGILYLAYVVFLGIKTPTVVPYMLGQTIGAILILLVFVVIGTVVRTRKSRRAITKS